MSGQEETTDIRSKMESEEEVIEPAGTDIGVGESTDKLSAEGSDSAAAGSAEQGNAVAQLENRIRELETENSELKDRYIRKQADYENFRKRMFREREEAVRYANSELLSDLITIIDDFERAIKSSEDSKDFGSFHSGIELIEKQFTGMLERKWGLKRFESAGEEFDPQRHEAIGMEEREDCDTQMVLEDYQKGYLLHDRVLRHAKVKVSIPAAKKDAGSVDADESNSQESGEAES